MHNFPSMMFYVEFYMFQIEITLHVLCRFYVKHVEKKVLDALAKTVRMFSPGNMEIISTIVLKLRKDKENVLWAMKIVIFFSARLTARVLPSLRLISSHFRRAVILEVNLTFLSTCVYVEFVYVKHVEKNVESRNCLKNVRGRQCENDHPRVFPYD